MSDDFCVDNHCSECNEFESECICSELDARDALVNLEQFSERVKSESDRMQILWDLHFEANTLRSHLENAGPEVTGRVCPQWLQVARELLEATLAHSPETLSRLFPAGSCLGHSPTSSPVDSGSHQSTSVSSPSSLVLGEDNAFGEGDTFPKRFVGFFQSVDGTGYAYTVEAEDHSQAESRIAGRADSESLDPGEVMVYDASELRSLADRLDDPACEVDIPEPEVATT